MQGIPPGLGGMQQGIPPNMQMGMTPVMSPAMSPSMGQVMSPNMAPNMPPAMGNPMQMQHQPNSQKTSQDPNENEAEAIATFLNKLNEMQFVIPDQVMNNICAQAGLMTTDPKIIRLLTLAIQNLLLSQINECKKKSPNDHLQLSTVKNVLNNMNISVHRPEYIISPIDSEDTNTDDTQGYDYMEGFTWEG